MNALREANPTDGLGREINGECMPARSVARYLPGFSLWLAEYQQKMDDPRLASDGSQGRPDQRIQESRSRHE